jgi:L-fucose mutarotase/ribose pyranase (RbsD/FucU family)
MEHGNGNGAPAGDGATESQQDGQQDLVVIDRHSLKQLLTAVITALEASSNLDSAIRNHSIEDGDAEKIQGNITTARDTLIQGARQILASVDELPQVDISDIEMDEDG